MSPTPVPAPGPRRGAVYDWFSEFALVSVTVVVAAGMSRLFTDSSFLRDVLALAVVSHVIAAAARRARLSTPSAALLWVVGLVVTATMLLYGQTAWFVLPTLDTFDAARDHLVDSWSVINASEAPVEPVPGLVLSAGAVLGLSAFLADTGAFRMRAAVTSVVPVSAVYGFTIAAGTGDGAVVHGALFGGTIGATMVALRLRNRRADAWIEPGPGRGRAGPGPRRRRGVAAGRGGGGRGRAPAARRGRGAVGRSRPVRGHRRRAVGRQPQSRSRAVGRLRARFVGCLPDIRRRGRPLRRGSEGSRQSAGPNSQPPRRTLRPGAVHGGRAPG